MIHNTVGIYYIILECFRFIFSTYVHTYFSNTLFLKRWKSYNIAKWWRFCTVLYSVQRNILKLLFYWIELTWIQLNSIQFSWIEFNLIKFNSISLNWIELSYIELNWMKLNQIELNWIQSNSIQFGLIFLIKFNYFVLYQVQLTKSIH